MSAGAVRWLEPLQPSIPGLGTGVLARIARFDDALTTLLDVYPVDHGLDPATRSLHLRQVRQRLSADGILALAVPARYGGHGHPAGLQVLLQFACGYHDVNLRDSTGLGHGQLIADNATPQARDRWLPRILAGAVPGIAITESHGGTRVHATTTHAAPAGDGTWRVSGTKTWISTQSTASTRPGDRSRPNSSRTSRRHAACGDSSASTAPPGRSHTGLYVGSTSSTRPASSRNSALAAIRLRASDATY